MRTGRRMTFPEGMPERINDCICKSGLYCTEVAKLLGVERKAIYNYRTGETVPNATIIARMCNLFNVSADYLIFGVEK